MNGTVISGSNDYSNWTQITDAVTGVKKGQPEWKEVPVRNDSISETGYRYLKISGAQYGNIAEVRIFGTVNEVTKQDNLVTVTSSMISVSGGGSATGVNIVDGKWDTSEDMRSNTSAYYTIDFGSGKAITPTEFHLSPYSNANSENDSKNVYLPAMNGTTIYGSNNNSDWTPITTAVSGAKYGWNVVNVLASVKDSSYRYLKIVNTNGVALSEIEIYGTVGEGTGEPEPEQPDEPPENAIDVKNLAASMKASSESYDGKETAEKCAQNLFDGDINTFGDLKTGNNTYTIDFGASAVTPTAFWVYPRGGRDSDKPAEYVARLNGLKFQGSDDGENWEDITEALSGINASASGTSALKWYKLDVTKTDNYRYIQITGATSGNMAEVKIYGDVTEVEETPLDVLKEASNITASTNRSNIGTVFQMAEQLFDGKTDTYGDLLVENGGFFVIDFGPGKAVNPTKFQLHPRATDNNLADRMNGTIISGSNDYSDWTEITDAVSGVQNTDKAWVDVALKNDVTIPENGYRYLKISGAKWGNIAEVRIYGSVGEAESQIKPVSLDSATITASAGKDNVTAEEMARRITDGDFNTYGDMTGGKNANFIIDFGGGKAVIPTKFHLYPRSDDKESDNNKYRDRMNQTIIYGSNDNETWTELTEAVSDAQYGWNVVSVKDSITISNGGYRYLKISGADGGAIAEIEIYGEVSSN